MGKDIYIYKVLERKRYGESIKKISEELGCSYYSILRKIKKLNLEIPKMSNKYDLSGEFGVGYAINTNDEFLFDLDDYDKIKEFPWYCKKTIDNHKYMENKSDKYRAIHRIVVNAKEGEYVDHINRDTLDNRKLNLRIVTNQQNGFNSSLSKKNTSGIIGVRWDKNKDLWIARIKYNYKDIYLKGTKDKELAIKTRLETELKYFGLQFAPQRDLFKKYGVV